MEKRSIHSGPRAPPPKPSSGNVGKAMSVAAAGSVLFGKTKYLLAGLKLTKAAPLASMVLTSGAYALVFGPAFGVGMVGLTFVHECGHLVMLRHYGVPFSPMVFIPFMGAVVAMKAHPRTAEEEAYIAFGGPVMGGAAAMVCAGIGDATDSQILMALADFGYMINLFNLLPIGQMDGGRIANAISPYFSAAGLAGGFYLAYIGAVQNPIFYIILLAGGYDTANRALGWSDRPPGYYDIGAGKQLQLLAGLGALIAALVYGMKKNDRKRKTPRQIERERERGRGGGWTDDQPAPWDSGEDGKYDDYFSGPSSKF